MTVYLIVFCILAVAGLYIALSLAGYSIDGKAIVVQKFCTTISTNNCAGVLKSRYSIIWGAITWVDLAVLYFAIQCLFVLQSICYGDLIDIVFVWMPVAILACIATISLLWVQKIMLKQWCRICLMLTTIIWLQEIFLLLSQYCCKIRVVAITTQGLETGIKALIISIGLGSIWFFVKSKFVMATKSDQMAAAIQKIKNDDLLFLFLLRNQKKVQPGMFAKQEFVLGNLTAPIKILLIINPFCSICRDEYPKILKLLFSFPEYVTVIVRFSINYENKKTESAVKYLIGQYLNPSISDKALILSEWFEKVSALSHQIATIFDESVNTDVVNQILFLHKSWIESEKIKYSPWTYINFSLLPEPFDLSDLHRLMPKLVQRLKTNSDYKGKQRDV